MTTSTDSPGTTKRPMTVSRRLLVAAAAPVAVVVLLSLAAAMFAGADGRGRFTYWLREEAPVAAPLRWTLLELRNPPLSPAEAGNGGPASNLALVYPSGMTADAQGNVYLADRGAGTAGRMVWRITPAGQAEHLAGTGRRGRAHDGPDARKVALGSPEGMTIDGDGRLHIADSYSDAVLRVNHDGSLERVAGNGTRGFSGDGGAARQAQLNAPYDVRFDAAGNLYVADFGNHRIRVIRTDGTIDTVVGSGNPGYTGDGGPALRADLHWPYGVAVDEQQRLLIADSFNHVIRRVEHDGSITTIAGTGELGYAGDGGPAVEALLDTPQALFVDDSGTVFIGDEHNHAIRKLLPDGTIQGLIGTGRPGLAAPGTPTDVAAIDDPEMVILVGGQVLIVENGNGRVIRLGEAGIEIFAGRPPE